MATKSKLAGFALGVVAVALTVTGVILAATDPNPGGVARDSFHLGGYPPTSATLHVTVSDGPTLSASADVTMNFSTNAIEAVVSTPLVLSTTSFDVRLVKSHLYITSANMKVATGATWLSLAQQQPSLFGLSLEMTKPDIALISGFSQELIRRSGDFTTYEFRRDNVSLGSGSSARVLRGTSGDLTITVGREGEVTGASLTLTSKSSVTNVTATVVSYNRHANIVAPTSKDVKSLSVKQLQKLFDVAALLKLLSPTAQAMLGTTPAR